MGGKAVSERMDAFAFVDARFLLRPVVNSLSVVDRNRSPLAVGEKVSWGAMLFPIRAQL